jgi:hypothetical protein
LQIFWLYRFPALQQRLSILKCLFDLLGERELVEFLAEEIVAERKAGAKKSLPAELEGFKIKTEGAEVELIKDLGKEK